jgi:ParB-like chromosome segregation protein Spo0J
LRSLPVAFLQPGKFQPRMTFDEQPLQELAASIKEKGVAVADPGAARSARPLRDRGG